MLHDGVRREKCLLGGKLENVVLAFYEWDGTGYWGCSSKCSAGLSPWGVFSFLEGRDFLDGYTAHNEEADFFTKDENEEQSLTTHRFLQKKSRVRYLLCRIFTYDKSPLLL